MVSSHSDTLRQKQKNDFKVPTHRLLAVFQIRFLTLLVLDGSFLEAGGRRTQAAADEQETLLKTR